MFQFLKKIKRHVTQASNIMHAKFRYDTMTRVQVIGTRDEKKYLRKFDENLSHSGRESVKKLLERKFWILQQKLKQIKLFLINQHIYQLHDFDPTIDCFSPF